MKQEPSTQSRGTQQKLFHDVSEEWRTARQGSEAANSAETARYSDQQPRSLPEPHTRTQGDPGRFSHDSLHSASTDVSAKHPGSPSGRLRTAPTATLSTATQNGTTAPATALSTAREGKRPRTGWELRELIRPLSVRQSSRRQNAPDRPFDPALIEWIYLCRFALVDQLQRRFPIWLPSLRTAQRHVRRLVDARYLATVPVRSTGPHFPAVVCATGRGIRLIRETYERHGQEWNGPVTEERKAKGLALDSVHHELAITEFDLALYRTIEQRPDLMLLDRERRYFRKDRELRYSREGRTRRIAPDAGYQVARASGNDRQLLPLMLLELENGTHTVARIRRKLEAYRHWSESEEGSQWLRRAYAAWGEPDRPQNFRLLLVAHDKYGTVSDERRLADLFVQTLALPRSIRDAIWLTTAADLRRHQNDPSPLDSAIWYLARDARKWLSSDPHVFRSSGNRARDSARQREFVSANLTELPLHGLFPGGQAIVTSGERGAAEFP